MFTAEGVAHLTTVHPRDDVRIFHKECVSIAAAGYTTFLVVADGKGDASCSGVQVVDIGRVQGRFLRMLVQPWRMWRVSRRLRAKLYHFHDPELLPIGLLLRWGGAKVIYDSHEDVPRAVLSKDWILPWLRRLVATGFEAFEDFVARRLSAVVTATPHIARRFARLNRCTRDINNYPLLRELTDGVRAATEGRVVCYVGGIGVIRGVVEMVTALEHVDATLVMAGPFESAQTEARVRALPGWKRVDYRGTVSRDEVRRILASSRAGLLFFHPEPNHVDAQPNKMFEYMSAGLPVLASNFPLWRSLLEESGAGRCADAQDALAIARCIAALLDDPMGARSMGERGREAVTTTYQWAHEEKKLLAVYSEVLA